MRADNKELAYEFSFRPLMGIILFNPNIRDYIKEDNKDVSVP